MLLYICLHVVNSFHSTDTILLYQIDMKTFNANCNFSDNEQWPIVNSISMYLKIFPITIKKFKKNCTWETAHKVN